MAMIDLEFEIGGIKIKPILMREDDLSNMQFRLSVANHKFVVVNQEPPVLSLYAAQVACHADVLPSFGKGTLIGVGGGSFFTDSSNVLYFGHYSRSYGRVPKPVLERFAPLLKDALVQSGIPVGDTKVESYESEHIPFLEDFWKDLGYVQ